MSGNSSRLDVTERSFLSQSTSATDELDGFDDFDSEVSSTEDVASSCGTHSQPQKKSIKAGKAIKRLILPSILPSVRPHVHPCVLPTVGLSGSALLSDGAWAGLCLYVRPRGRPCGRVSVRACMHASVFVDVCTGMHACWCPCRHLCGHPSTWMPASKNTTTHTKSLQYNFNSS